MRAEPEPSDGLLLNAKSPADRIIRPVAGLSLQDGHKAAMRSRTLPCHSRPGFMVLPGAS